MTASDGPERGFVLAVNAPMTLRSWPSRSGPRRWRPSVPDAAPPTRPRSRFWPRSDPGPGFCPGLVQALSTAPNRSSATATAASRAAAASASFRVRSGARNRSANAIDL